MGWLGYMILGGFSILLGSGMAFGASEQAVRLRASGGLSPYAPPEGFQSANFVADEVEPAYIFGKVSDFARTRACHTTWLIEEGERKRIEADGKGAGPMEYSLYLEEDCPGRVTHYIFVDRSEADSAQWLEWRKQFHKSKTDPQYGAARSVLEEAARNGFPVGAELRFIVVDNELELKKPEEVLVGSLKVQPLYDLKQGKPFVP